MLLTPPPNRRRLPPQPLGAIFLPPRRTGLLVVSCQLSVAVPIKLYAALFRGTAAAVRERRDVLDAGDFQAGVLELDNRLLAACAGAFDLDFDLDHAVLAGLLGSLFGSAAGGEGGALAGAFEADGAGRRPGESLAAGVGDGHHGVVEGRLDVGDAAGDAFADALLDAGFGAGLGFCAA